MDYMKRYIHAELRLWLIMKVLKKVGYRERVCYSMLFLDSYEHLHVNIYFSSMRHSTSLNFLFNQVVCELNRVQNVQKLDNSYNVPF